MSNMKSIGSVNLRSNSKVMNDVQTSQKKLAGGSQHLSKKMDDLANDIDNFDQLKIFQFYFPHNNINTIVEKIELKLIT
jgi:hypothetical protein